MKQSLKKAAVLVTALSVVLVPAANAAVLKASGATSVSGLIDKCKADYQSATKHSFDYPGGGSGAGKTAFTNGTVDFAFSDSAHSPMIPNEIHIPTVLWPVAILTNLPGSNKPVTLSTDTVAGIFAGTIKNWNDPAIVADNNRSINTIVYRKDASGKVAKDAKGQPIVLRTQVVTQRRTMPNLPITVIYRSDNSGTSNNLARALNKLAPSVWTKAPADSFATAFPGTITADPVRFRSASGSAGVSLLASKTKGAITYAEVSFAATYRLGLSSIINKAGNAILPTSDSAAAAGGVATIDDSSGLLTFDYLTSDSDAYPFTATTYALVSTKYGDAAKAKAVKETLEFHAFKCPALYPALGFATVTPTSKFGAIVNKQLGKLGA
ncbi:MAG: substrate-binding domain-containing protein [Candidatus Nanopelagicaceae bacterium]|jgi:phosphate transport system substrate-binding protein